MTIIKLCIYTLVLAIVVGCNTHKFSHSIPKVDSISMKQFLVNQSICTFTLAQDFVKISPKMLPWATDTIDPYTESFLINGKRLKIIQPLKRFDFTDSIRRYTYNGKEIRTIRVVGDSLNFNFNGITIDYGNSSNNVFQKGAYILLRNQPLGWCGLANQYRFIQLFELKGLVCYEFFVNYYSCLHCNTRDSIQIDPAVQSVP